MKKLLYIASILALIIAACNPMEDFKTELDTPYKAEGDNSIEIVLSADDYAEIADLAGISSIGDNMYFTTNVSAKDNVPFLLDDRFAPLATGSYAYITYKFYAEPEYLVYLTQAEAYELTTADYDSMGEDSGEPGRYNNFSSSTPPEDYLPAFFLSKYPAAEADDLVYVTYKYYSGSVNDVSEYYQFDGTAWAAVQVEVPAGVVTYTLSSDDYDSMGESSGKPGRYNNFSSSTPPDAYLPTFLANKYPFAAAGEKVAVIFKYYAGSTQTRALEYTFDGMKWAFASVVTDLFVQTPDGWIFDPSIVLTMATDDYQTVVDYVKANHADEDPSTYSNTENYYGASAYYNNFDIRSGKYNAKFATWQAAVSEGIALGLLPAKYPSATTTNSDGIDMFYKVTFNTYSGSDGVHTFVFQCTKSGPNPEFTYIP